MKTYLHLAVVLCAVTLSLPVHCLAQEKGPVSASVCDVTVRPKKYADQNLAIPATLVWDGIHVMLLTDPKCKKGLPVFGEVSESEPTIVNLDHCLRHNGPVGTAQGKSITGVFQGQIRWRESPSRFGLILESIGNLECQQIKRQTDGDQR
jgi:hypothetical protein